MTIVTMWYVRVVREQSVSQVIFICHTLWIDGTVVCQSGQRIVCLPGYMYMSYLVDRWYCGMLEWSENSLSPRLYLYVIPCGQMVLWYARVVREQSVSQVICICHTSWIDGTVVCQSGQRIACLPGYMYMSYLVDRWYCGMLEWSENSLPPRLYVYAIPPVVCQRSENISTSYMWIDGTMVCQTWSENSLSPRLYVYVIPVDRWYCGMLEWSENSLSPRLYLYVIPCGQMVLWYARVVREQPVSQVIWYMPYLVDRVVCQSGQREQPVGYIYMLPCGQMVLWYARVVREQSVPGLYVYAIPCGQWIDGTVVCHTQSGQRIACLPGYIYMPYLVDRWYCGMLEWSENSLSPRLYVYVIPCGQMVLWYARVVREQPVSQVICICHTLWIDGTVVCQSGQRIACLPGYIYMSYLVDRWYCGMLEWSENSLSPRLYLYAIPCGQMVLWYARVVREQSVSQVIFICHTLWIDGTVVCQSGQRIVCLPGYMYMPYLVDRWYCGMLEWSENSLSPRLYVYAIPCGQMVLWYARVVREQSVSQVICICHTLWIDGTVVCQSGQRIVCLPGYMYMSYLVDRWYCGMLEWSENSLSPRLYVYVIPCGQMVLWYARVVREQSVSQVICICHTLWIDGTVVCQSGQRIVCLPGYMYMPYLVDRWYCGMLEWSENSLSPRLYVYAIPCGQMVLWYVRVVREQSVSQVICICHTLWIDGTAVCQSGQRIVCLPGYMYMSYLVDRWYCGMLEWSENSLSPRLYVYVIPCGQMVLWYARVVREQSVSQVICICHTLWIDGTVVCQSGQRIVCLPGYMYMPYLVDRWYCGMLEWSENSLSPRLYVYVIPCGQMVLWYVRVVREQSVSQVICICHTLWIDGTVVCQSGQRIVCLPGYIYMSYLVDRWYCGMLEWSENSLSPRLYVYVIPCGQMVLWYVRVVREQSVSQVIFICHTLWIDGTAVCQSGQRIVCLPGYMYMPYLVDRWYCGMLEWSENSLSPRLYVYAIPCGQMVLWYARVVREQSVSQVICICHTLWIDGTVVCQSGQRIVCLPGYMYMSYLVDRWYCGMLEWSENSLSPRLYVYVIPCGQMVLWYDGQRIVCLPGYMYMSYLVDSGTVV